MKFEVLRKSHVKKNLLIGVVVIGVISAVILNFTKARYRVTQSIPLVNGTINHELSDLNIIGLYVNGEEVDSLNSSKQYILDIEQSTCTYKNGTIINELNISYDSATGELQITPFTSTGTKCTLFFDEYVESVRDVLLANYPTQLTRTNFSTTVTNTTTGTIYYADTSKGRTYYFAGNPTDNWVYFGGFYWRIIRINEDGTLRLIYQGTNANTTGPSTQTQTSAFNSTFSNNMYVGYMYQSNQAHGLTSDSIIKGVLDEWYQNNLTSDSDKIDGNTGFCGDRTPSSGTGLGTTETYYAAYNRLYTNKSPSFECSNSSDLYTTIGSSEGNRALQYPIGLISADEVAYAGGVWGSANQSYYLYTGQNYWIMSPCDFLGAGLALNFVSYDDGDIGGNSVNNTNGVRPVINLKSDVTIQSGTGTAQDPYII